MALIDFLGSHTLESIVVELIIVLILFFILYLLVSLKKRRRRHTRHVSVEDKPREKGDVPNIAEKNNSDSHDDLIAELKKQHSEKKVVKRKKRVRRRR